MEDALERAMTAVQSVNGVRPGLSGALTMDGLGEGTVVGGTDPEQFGALGDGKHDDGPALQAALQLGIPVVLNKDLYLLSDVQVTDRNVTLDGRGHTLYCRGGSLTFQASAWTVQTRPGVRGESAIVTEDTVAGGLTGVYHYGAIYSGGVELDAEAAGKTITRFDRYSASIRNLRLMCSDMTGKVALTLRRLCDSVVENLQVICEKDSEGDSGIILHACVNSAVRNCYCENWTAKSTYKTADRGYGIQVMGKNLHVEGCSGAQCKHSIIVAGARDFWSEGITVSDCNLFLDFDRGNVRSNGSLVHQQIFDCHADCTGLTVNNLNLYLTGDNWNESAYLMILRCPTASLSNVHIVSDGGKIAFGELAKDIRFQNLNAPDCSLRTDMIGMLGTDGYLEQLHVVGGCIRRLDAKAITPTNIYLTDVTVREYVEMVQYLWAKGCQFLRTMHWRSKPTITVAGQTVLDGCLVYGQRDEGASRRTPVLRAPEGALRLHGCKFVMPIGYPVCDTEQTDTANCWYEDVYGLSLDTQGILETHQLF